MKMIKRFFLLLVILLALLLGTAIAIPYFFKDRIVELVKEEVNKNIEAKFDFEDVNLSLLRSFPDFSLQLKEFEVIGVEEFDGVKLASGNLMDFTVDLVSAIKSNRPIEIESFRLEKPDINVQILKNGKANYDIVKSDPTSPEVSESESNNDLLIQLKKYSIEGGHFIYNDKSLDLFAEIEDLHHNGKGNFSSEVFDLITETAIEAISVNFAGISYLSKATTKLDAVLNANLPEMKFTLKDNKLLINALQLQSDGFVQLDGEDILLDLKFNAPQNTFKNLYSLIPNAYIQDYQDVKVDGNFRLDGLVKGRYSSEKEQLPAFKINMDVTDGNVKYPDLPLGISAIDTKASIDSPGDLDRMIIDVPRFHFELGDNPFDAALKLLTPISDPDIDAKVKGKIDLEQLTQAFPVEGIEELKGLITADVVTQTRMSTIEKEEYEKVNMSGNMQVQNVVYKSSDLPLVNVKDLKMNFTPKNVTIDNFTSLFGKSDIQANGSIDNILAWFSPEKTMTGTMTVRSALFDANEWLTEEESSENPPNTTETQDTETEIFDRFDFTLDAKIDEILYEDYEIKESIAKGNITPNKLTINDFSTKIGNSDVRGNGVIENIFNYLFEDENIFGNLNIDSRLLDLNQFMTEDPSAESTPESNESDASATDLSPFLVPAFINMDIAGNVQKLLYTNMELTNLNGKIKVENEEVVIETASANTLGGKVDISGGYNTQDHEKPEFALKFDLADMDFKQSFNTFNTFQKLAPIGKFITGKFNTSLIMGGALGKDLMPDLTTLSAEGFLHTINGIVSNFNPFKEIGNQLNIDYFDDFQVEETKNWFEVKDGKVFLEEFDYRFKEIDMKIGGSHSLNNEMDYNIKAKIPRKLLENSAIGAAANKGLGLLEQQASQLGVNLNSGEFVNVLINLKGIIADPKVKVKFLGLDGETSLQDAAETVVKEELEKAQEEVEALAKEEIEKGTEKAEEVVNTAIDSAKNVASQEIDKLEKEVNDAASELLKDEVDKTLKDSTLTKTVEDVFGKESKEGTDKIKENLEKFNPFGKKKKKKKKEEGGG